MRRRKRARERRPPGINHWLILGLGWGFILLGLVGLFLPLLQGILFLTVGVIILTSRSPRVRWLVLQLGRRYPKLRHTLAAAKRQAARLRRRFGGGRARVR